MNWPDPWDVMIMRVEAQIEQVKKEKCNLCEPGPCKGGCEDA